MSTTQADLASPTPWRRSLRRSRERRLAAARLRRRRFQARSIVVLTSIVMTAGGGAALAASGGTELLHRGSHGPSIAAVQRALGVPADGVYGAGTRRAVMAFQRSHGLIVDGIVGPQTLGALGLSGGDGTLAASSSSGVSPELQKIAECESSDNPTAVSADGIYRGKYQFSLETWRELGGSGDPASAPEAEQDRMAEKLMKQQGAAAWPSCA